ncbi:hypothetical protein DKT77_00390 [Meridianimarinicoccus roseus]|uniref:VPLPA-CTERM protein sorting domain-containing protein n=1 Tax=Meridianimarinicoccus roseus TaxID=2072018 RepID=A0A2V2LK31_9RHOB|nr:VPLPA-CTERM sorting domain-containing protein [Meridianimarinicoccus roseus]PWR04461.1 hypothetical protein DKT77_00390 [Meridianimarinicoccus roseus]
MRFVILSAPAVSLTSLLSGAPALAACVENPAGTYVCTGLQTGGLTDNGDDVSVTVVSGAEVQNAGGDALRVRGNDTTVVNNGTLTADGDGVDSGDDGFGLTVINTGSMNVQARGVNADNEDNVTVDNSGTINAPNNDGIRLGDGVNATFRNTGVLISGDEGMEAGNSATVLNRTGASITALEDAVQVGEDAQILNEGAIISTGTDGDGLDMDSGIVINTATGTIATAASSSAGIDFDASAVAQSVIVNSGSIEGGIGIQVELGGADPANTQTQIVLTDGIITGTGGLAVELGEGADTVAVFDSLAFLSQSGVPVQSGDVVDVTLGSGAAAQINGLVSLGAGDDSAGFFNMADGGMLYDAVLDDIFDGGADTDTAFFSAGLAELASSVLAGEVLSLTFASGQMTQVVNFRNFEFFTFGIDPVTGLGGQTVALADLTAPIPLPAGLLLLGGGLAVLGAARARRRA